MSFRDTLLIFLQDYGRAATLTKITGDVCPCWSYRGSGYSADYHALEGAVADCEGTGILKSSQVTTTTNIKGVFYDPQIVGVRGLPDFAKVPLGWLNDSNIFMIGTLDTTNLVYLDLSGYVNIQSKLTLGSVDYEIRKIIDIDQTLQIGQIAKLIRKS